MPDQHAPALSAPSPGQKPVRGLPGLVAVVRARGYRSLSHFARESRELPAALYGFARGDVSPTTPTIIRLCALLECSADVLLGLMPAPASK